MPHVLTADEIDALLASPDTSTTLGLRDRAMIETLYATGLRVSEMVGLTTDRVRLDPGYVRVIGKGRKERVVPLGDSAISLDSTTTSGARDPSSTAITGPSCSSTTAAAPSPARVSGRSSAATRVSGRSQTRPSARTSCATPSPPTWSRTAPTCGPYR